MKYPRVLTEFETLDEALRGRSISRFGDGELRMALGGNCISQVKGKALAKELRAILRGPTKSLVCIPNAVKQSPKYNKTWQNYTNQKYVALYGQKTYGSAFITRPDSAPWINVDEYWNKVEQLWIGKHVTLVVGMQITSINERHLHRAADVRVVLGPQRDAYAQIDRIEADVGKASGPVIMCLGGTATCLAERLAKRGIQALDLGHLGKFAGRNKWIVPE